MPAEATTTTYRRRLSLLVGALLVQRADDRTDLPRFRGYPADTPFSKGTGPFRSLDPPGTVFRNVPIALHLPFGEAWSL